MPVTVGRKYAEVRDGEFKTVQKVVPIELYMAAGIVDGEGKKSNRLIFRPVGGDKFYFLFPQGTEENMKTAAPWLQTLLESECGDHAAALPDEKAKDIDTGSPL